MKWVTLAAILLTAGFLIGLLRSQRKYLPVAAFALGLLPFLESRFHLLTAPVSWAMWAGESKGFELSFVDAVAIAILFASPSQKSPLRLKLVLALIMTAFLISIFAAPMKTAAGFVGWDLIRSCVIFLAVTRGSLADKDFTIGLMRGLIAGLFVQACVVVTQYAGGDTRAGGWFGHPNLLGFSTEFIAFPAFAALIAGYYRKSMLVAVGASLIIAFAGASRATLGLLALGFFLTAVFSIWHHSTGRKSAIIFAAVLGFALIAPVLYSALDRRSAEDRQGSSQMRDAMKEAAMMIVDDHPLGIGANQYVLVANQGGYSERAGVPWSTENRAAPVHNSYYLVTAEMGWLGLIALVALFAGAFSLAVQALRRAGPSFGGELAAGAAATFLTVAVHSYFEWIFMMHVGQTFFAMILGVAAAVSIAARKSAVAARRALRTNFSAAGPATGALPTG